MIVKYEFNLNDKENDDEYELNLVQIAKPMFNSLEDLDDLRRNLNKGYRYFPAEEDKADNDKYEKINLNKLLDDLSEILTESKIFDIE